MWEWNKNTPEDLARYTLPQAAEVLNNKVPQAHDILRGANGHYNLSKAIYDALGKSDIDYAAVPYSTYADAVKQPVRTPMDIKNEGGTCLDLALLYCGVCLHYELLPVVILLKGHALAAVSLTHPIGKLEAIRGLWRNGPIRTDEALSSLRDSSMFVVVECTGFSRADTFPIKDSDKPEGWWRIAGRQGFDAACKAGAAQLGVHNRPFEGAIHIAYSQRHRGYKPQVDTTMPMNHARDITQGVNTLRVLKDTFPKVRSAVQNGRSNLIEIDRHISELNVYKELHNQLHLLYLRCFNPIRNKILDMDAFDVMDIDYNDLSDYADILDGIVAALQKIAQPFNSITLSEGAWIAEIEEALGLLKCVVNMSDAPEARLAKLWDVIGLLSTVTYRHPSRINDKLYGLLETLPLPILKQAMLEVRAAIDGIKDASPPSHLVGPYEEGIRQLDNLTDVMKRLLDDHNIMQGCDTKLREIEEEKRYLRVGFADIWRPIDTEAKKCYESSQEREAKWLREAAANLETALKSRPDKVGERFITYRSSAGRLFFRIDERLMGECNKLEEVRQALSKLWQ